ncbi:hypothetical protein LWI29_009073 [Acer saccharum]|uniref:Uncharacterized protein n=1 Tax=Acer saccharum TaxID=4024 RepID=A0AA39RKR4_ACESA|nr:hypothetical protein LWI29_009073 [Acer saccharum]
MKEVGSRSFLKVAKVGHNRESAEEKREDKSEEGSNRENKGHSMRTKSSKFKLSWILEEEISKVIDMSTTLGFDFNDKEVQMVDAIENAFLKLKGDRLKMVKN